MVGKEELDRAYNTAGTGESDTNNLPSKDDPRINDPNLSLESIPLQLKETIRKASHKHDKS